MNSRYYEKFLLINFYKDDMISIVTNLN
jgi:hypothetical protein